MVIRLRYAFLELFTVLPSDHKLNLVIISASTSLNIINYLYMSIYSLKLKIFDPDHLFFNRLKYALFSLFFIVALFISDHAANAAGFNCEMARAQVEKIIINHKV